MEDAWAEIQAYVMEVLDWAGVDAIEAEELSVIPGLDEIFSLSDIKTYADRASGTSSSSTARRRPRRIRFLSLPDILALVHGAALPGRAPASVKVVRPCCRG